MTALRSIPLDAPDLVVSGALEVDRRADRIRLGRVPAAWRHQSPEPAFDLMARMTSGVRLTLWTDAELVELDAQETGLEFEGEPRRRAVVEVCADDGLVGTAELNGGPTVVVGRAGVTMRPGAPSRVRIALPPGAKRVDLWLPQSAATEVRGLWIPVAAGLFPLPAPERRRWAHYGSSISHGMEAAGPASTWPAMAARARGLDLYNLGLAGQCHLDPFMARVIRDGGFDLISLKIGVNISAADALRRRTFGPALHGFLDLLREAAPATPILVISPIFSPLIEASPGPLVRGPGPVYRNLARPDPDYDGALGLAELRRLAAEIVEGRIARGDGALRLLDGLALLGPADAPRLADQLHPDPEGHAAMAERFLQRVPDWA